LGENVAHLSILFPNLEAVNFLYHKKLPKHHKENKYVQVIKKTIQFFFSLAIHLVGHFVAERGRMSLLLKFI
jgi:hypothetical protein